MFETLNINGYDLYQLPNHPDQWAVRTGGIGFSQGTLKYVVLYMIDRLGFHMDDIEEGIYLLADNVKQEHNCIHFGALRTPIFTFKKEENYGKRAS